MFDESLNAIADLVADLANSFNRLALGILKRPVVALRSRNVGTLITAPHRHQPLRLLSKFWGQPGGRCAHQIDANFAHRRDHFWMDACAWIGTCRYRSRFRNICELVEPRGSHL